MAGSSQLTLFSSTRMPSVAAVNALLFDAMAKMVFAFTGALSPILRTPYPFSKMTLSSLTTATAMPGTFHSFIVFWM